jgi:exopolyphosphatase / guanosine-5'-triphosphate,3'-diphosphate pyrophosphatase
MIVAVVDVGTNSTRLLVADVRDARVARELERRTDVTRLGEGVDETGRLADAAVARVISVCASYRDAIDRHGAERVVAVLTSAVRDAANGGEFERALAERFGFDATTISGEREARLTYLGATTGRPHGEPVLVLDIGGGSTEIVVGRGERLEFFASVQLGSVRHTERFLHADPPTQTELEECRATMRETLERSVPAEVCAQTRSGIAVAGTPTSFAAIDMRLEPYDRERVDGYRLSLAACERILAALAAIPVSERRHVRGLHPDRAPTIVAGGIILVETMRLFDLSEIEVSEHDILEGAALEAAEIARKTAQNGGNRDTGMD